MNSKDMQAIGLCRFSYPAMGGFQVNHESSSARADYLYAPNRMEERFRTFKCLTLPALKKQTDENFIFIVLTGSDLPKDYAERLFELLDGFSQVALVQREPGPHRTVMQEVINQFRDDRKEPCLQFRLDDDDAVSVDFIEKLREAAQDLRPMLRKHRHMAIDFCRGFVASPFQKGLLTAQTIQSCWTPALAVSARRGTEKTVMNFAHAKLAHNMPLVSFGDQPMFVRGHNAYNDSRQKARVKHFNLEPQDAAQEAMFKERFAIDADQIREVFGAADLESVSR